MRCWIMFTSFLARVAQGRNMSIQQVDLIAKGRVWSGTRAIDVGLADQFGGLMSAIDYAATLNGGQSRDDVYVQIFPKPKTPFEQLMEIMSGEGAPRLRSPDSRAICSNRSGR